MTPQIVLTFPSRGSYPCGRFIHYNLDLLSSLTYVATSYRKWSSSQEPELLSTKLRVAIRFFQRHSTYHIRHSSALWNKHVTNRSTSDTQTNQIHDKKMNTLDADIINSPTPPASVRSPYLSNSAAFLSPSVVRPFKALTRASSTTAGTSLSSCTFP